MIAGVDPITVEILVGAGVVTALSAYWYFTHHRCPNVIEWKEFVGACQSQTRCRIISEPPVYCSRGKNLIAKPGLHIQTYASTKTSAPLLEAVEDEKPVKEVEDPVPKSLSTAMVQIQKRTVGVFIGKLGSNIRQMQKESNTVMHLNDDVLENGDRICVIRGSRDCVGVAMEMVAKFLESLPIVVIKEMLVPKNTVGRIIGLDGKGIRSIEEQSSATVYVDMNREVQNSERRLCRFAILKGTKEQIEKAEQIILAEIEEHDSVALKLKHGNIMQAVAPKIKPPIPDIISEQFQQPHLELNRRVEVFVSCVYHPNMFWIQLIGQESIDLRRLSEAMTEYYYRKNSRYFLFRPGDFVAAPFHWDRKMYRARVLKVHGNKMVDVIYVDYGDIRTVRTNFVHPLMPEFYMPKFQAIKASLNLSCPGMTWPDETVTKFCDLSYCAKWKSLTAEFKGFMKDERDGKLTGVCVELIDKGRNLGEELIEKGFAAKRETVVTARSVLSHQLS